MLGRELQEEVDGVVKQQDSNGVPGFRGAGLHNALLVGVANEREALHRAAIADLADLGELAKLRDFAREQWGEDPEFYPELEALLDHRQAELEERPGTQIGLPLNDE